MSATKANIASLRSFLDEGRESAVAAHRSGADGFQTCASLASMMDEAIGATYATVAEPGRGEVAVLALGGYGRSELFPHSDVDIMVLCRPDTPREVVNAAATDFLHPLWDAGLNIGHSVRTLDEALALRGNTLDAWTAMLEARPVCGNGSLVVALQQRMRDEKGTGEDLWFIEGVASDVQSRHARFGSSTKLLEPQVKKSAGGLRDLHAIYWLYRAMEPDTGGLSHAGRPVTWTFLDYLRDRDILGAEEHDAAVAAVRFLFRVRHEMHYQRQTQHDTLEYALQLQVAEGLGYMAGNGLRAVELFMHDYYRHARTVFRLYQRLSQRFLERIQPVRHHQEAGTRIGSAFRLHEELLCLDQGVSALKGPHQVLEAFVIAAEEEVDLDFGLRQAMEEQMGALTAEQCQTPEYASLFRRILLSRRVGTSLHEMNEMGLLARFIPEWADLVAFFQHNVYHYFTADEHTLIAVANVERLRAEQGFLHEVFRNIRRREILYLAILLHDIAKPRGVSDHEITGVSMAQTILRRLGMDEAFPDVGFLVRNHLVMEQIAFRRNVHDPETIKDFASRFVAPYQLDYLYLLTYADLSAVNPSVWTEWKAGMLQDLYQRTAEVLTRNLRGTQVDEFHHAQREAAAEQVIQALSNDLPRDTVERHLQGMQNAAYLSLFTEDEIARHIQTSAQAETVTTICTAGTGSTDVTVIARDAPFALSKFCAVLAANDANIFDATIFTRDDGIIIDRFRVSDVATRQPLRAEACAKIAQDMKDVYEERVSVDHLLREHRRRWKRRPRGPVNPTVRTDVTFEDNPKYTIIDVYAPDAVGFLYRVTETMSRLGLDIYFAKIATRIDGILDAFYVLDRSGMPVTSPERRRIIRNEILATIADLGQRELA